jgi:multicomponent Na+:H+ antiporter subunit G
MPTDWVTWLEWLTLSVGVVLCLLAGVGILRMPDVYTRMQASTKAGTLGIALIMAAVGLHFRDAVTGLQAALVIGFLFLTAPVASHLIARAAYALGASVWKDTVIDEMAAVTPMSSPPPPIPATESDPGRSDPPAGS